MKAHLADDHSSFGVFSVYAFWLSGFLAIGCLNFQLNCRHFHPTQKAKQKRKKE
jgi:hypothetical protein